MTQEDGNQPTSIILAIDTGSSSVRCSAYNVVCGDHNDDHNDNVVVMDGCFSSRKFKSLTPEGKFNNIQKLIEETNQCMDETLSSLRKKNISFEIIGVAMSSFVMNLIGVNQGGIPVGEWATLSYACNSPSVTEQCKQLKRYENKNNHDTLHLKKKNFLSLTS